MSDIAVEVHHVWKRFHRGEVHHSLRDLVPAVAKRLVGRGPKSDELAKGDFWALRDVSFRVKQGEVLGIIGANGAGKSTLLKILSKILKPNRGSMKVNGRLRALIEVAAGFHQDLTGRENIYLNGAILGMTRREIDRKFDEIVDFSGIESSLDTPVKRYSSGMYARLGFAVAAHLEPEVLIVDEVLSVGDADFQKKCLGKMSEIGAAGRTILFVSHNMPAVIRLCNRALLIESGTLVDDGDPAIVAREYLGDAEAPPLEKTWPHGNGRVDVGVQLLSVRIRGEMAASPDLFDIHKPIHIDVEYLQSDPAMCPSVILHLINEDDVCLFASNDFSDREWWRTPRARGNVTATCTIPGNFLAEGRMSVHVGLGSYNPNVLHVFEQYAVSFTVVDRTEGDGVRGDFVGNWPGVVRPMLQWSVDAVWKRPEGR